MTPSNAIEAADWIPGRLHPFAQDVGSVVPTGFGAYARIFHPAWTSSYTQQAIPAGWSEVAAANGTVVHPEMQFHTISRSVRGGHTTSGWDGEPRMGVLPDSQGVVLAEILARHTATPSVCWFCLWEGYGSLHPGGKAWFVSAPSSMRWRRIRLWWLRRNLRRRQPLAPTGRRVRLPHRDYFLFRGSVAQGAGWDSDTRLSGSDAARLDADLASFD